MSDNNTYNVDGPDADIKMQFSLLSTNRLTNPPVSFTVSDGPPTIINCAVNGKGISTKLSRAIVNGTGSVTGVTVTVRLKEAGNYQCTVSNDRVTDHTGAVSSTSSLNVSG